MGNADKNREEVRFEGVDGALSGIALVDVGGDQLELGTPLFCDETLILSAGFIVQNLQVYLMAQSPQTSHDCVVGQARMTLVSQW